MDHLRDHYRTSERRACRVLRIGRGTYRYQSHQEPWTELRLRIREIAQSRVRYGYRKIRVLLNREGWQVGKHLVYRLYREEGLALKKRPQRKRKAVKQREERFVATAPNQAWSLDFVADQLQDGRRFRCLTIIDVYTRASVAIEAGQSLKGEDVVRTLNRLKQERGVPKMLFCDNGSEFTSQAMDLWAYQNGVKIDFSRPGKPTDNAFVESFNGTFRAECLNAHWFDTARSQGTDRGLEAGIQCESSSPISRREDARRIRNLNQPRTNSRLGTKRLGQSKTGESLIIPGLKMGAGQSVSERLRRQVKILDSRPAVKLLRLGFEVEDSFYDFGLLVLRKPVIKG